VHSTRRPRFFTILNLIGLPVVAGLTQLTYHIVVQVPGAALRVDAATLKRLLPQLPELHRILTQRLAALQRDGAITGTRGAISIVSRHKLYHFACECYEIFQQFNRDLGLAVPGVTPS
jgi:hypothetical protein